MKIVHVESRGNVVRFSLSNDFERIDGYTDVAFDFDHIAVIPTPSPEIARLQKDGLLPLLVVCPAIIEQYPFLRDHSYWYGFGKADQRFYYGDEMVCEHLIDGVNAEVVVNDEK